MTKLVTKQRSYFQKCNLSLFFTIDAIKMKTKCQNIVLKLRKSFAIDVKSIDTTGFWAKLLFLKAVIKKRQEK